MEGDEGNVVFFERSESAIVCLEGADGDVIFWGRAMGNAGNTVFAMAEMERAGAPAEDSEIVVRAAGAEAGRATAVKAGAEAGRATAVTAEDFFLTFKKKLSVDQHTISSPPLPTSGVCCMRPCYTTHWTF